MGAMSEIALKIIAQSPKHARLVAAMRMRDQPSPSLSL